MKTIQFNKLYKQLNITSIILIVVSLFLLMFKGLNFGVDFKGGTLIEIRTDQSSSKISLIRDSFNQMNLGDVSVKSFGNETDYIVKFEKKNSNDPDFIENIKKKLSSSIGKVDFRRVENVGPKVSAELLRSGIIAIGLSLAAMLLYIWIRFEWQFSLGAIIALFHDVILTLGIFSLFSLEINLSNFIKNNNYFSNYVVSFIVDLFVWWRNSKGLFSCNDIRSNFWNILIYLYSQSNIGTS